MAKDANEIFGKLTGDNYRGPPNPYFLVYVREDQIDELVETVKRDGADLLGHVVSPQGSDVAHHPITNPGRGW